MPRVYIILLNWNGLADTVDCLRSLSRLDYQEFGVIVVDNCSADDSVAVIRTRFPDVVVIANERNLGFTGGNNIGIRHAVALGADYVWLLNNDTVVEPDSLRRLVEQGEASPETGMLSPAIYCFGDTARKQFVGSYIDWQTLEVLYPDRAFESEEEFRYGEENICLWGTALFIKRATLERIGYLDDAYFAYWEDTEYSLRALRHDLKNAVCLKARIYHKSPLDDSSSPKGKHYYYLMLRNRLFLRKYLTDYRSMFFFYRNYLSILIAESGGWWQKGSAEKFHACVNGAWHGLRNVAGPMTDTPPAPRWIAFLLKMAGRCHPFFISYLVAGNFGKIGQELAGRIRRRRKEDRCEEPGKHSPENPGDPSPGPDPERTPTGGHA